jgi:hypothetical protein
MAAMSRRSAVLAVLAGLACFALGVGATRLLGWGPPASPTPAASADDVALPWLQKDAGLRLMMPMSESDGGAKEPRILFDPDSITLLPDASLRLDPALVGDAGEP